MMNGTAIRDSVCAVLVLAAFAVGVTMCMHSAGCAPSSEKLLRTVEDAEVTLPYAFSLDACLDEAKKKPKPQQLEVYQQCADLETRKVCERSPRLRAGWKRCLEVMP